MGRTPLIPLCNYHKRDKGMSAHPLSSTSGGFLRLSTGRSAREIVSAKLNLSHGHQDYTVLTLQQVSHKSLARFASPQSKRANDFGRYPCRTLQARAQRCLDSVSWPSRALFTTHPPMSLVSETSIGLAISSLSASRLGKKRDAPTERWVS